MFNNKLQLITQMFLDFMPSTENTFITHTIPDITVYNTVHFRV